MHVVCAAAREVQRPELGVGLAVVRHRRHDAGLERLHRHHVLDAGAHRVAGEALGVGDDDAVGTGAEHAPERVDFGRGRAATRRGVGLVRDEHRLRRDRRALHAARLGLLQQRLHHRAYMLDVKPRAVERRVGDDRAHQLADGRQAPLARRRGRLDHEGRRTHADDHPVAAPVERRRRVLDLLVGRRGAGGEEAARDPGQQHVARDVVGRDDDHAPAAAGTDPVLGDRERLRRRGAGRVDLRVRPARADDLGKLRVAHRQRAEQEAAVELVRVRLELVAQLRDQRIDLGARGGVRPHPGAQPLERQKLLAARAILRVGLQLLGEAVAARERAREHDSGVVAQRVGQAPAVGQLRAERRRLVAHHQRQAGVAHRIEPGAERQPRRHVERLVARRLDGELLHDVEGRVAAGELDDLRRVVDRLEGRAADVALDEARDAHVDHAAAHLGRHRADELLAREDAADVGVVEDALHARQAERGTGDHQRLGVVAGAHRGGRRCHVQGAGGGIEAVQPQPLLQHAGEQPAELNDAVVAGERADRGGHRGHRGGSCHPRARRSGGRQRDGRARHRRARRRDSSARRRSRTGAGRSSRRRREAEPGRPQAAQRLVEGRDVALLRVIGEQREHVVVGAEHVLDEAMQRALGPDLDVDARPGVVQGAQPLDELHRRRDLAAEDLDHLCRRGGGRVELARDVGHERNPRRLHVEPLERAAQRHRRRRDDRGVEGVADRDARGLDAHRRELRHRGLDGARRAADHRLRHRVDVGDHDVAVARVDHALDLLERAHHRRHRAVVLDLQVRHLAPARAHRFERGLEGQRPGGDQRAVFAEAVAHHHVGPDAIGGEQPLQRQIGGEQRRLRDLGLAQVLLELSDGRLVGGVDEDVGAERTPEQRRHHRVGAAERVGDERLVPAQHVEHVHVLRALAGVEEGHLGRRPAADEGALLAQHAEQRRVAGAQRPDQLVELGSQFAGIGEVDRRPHRGAADRGIGPRQGRCAAGTGLGQGLRQLRHEVGVVARAEHQRAAQRRLAGVEVAVGRCRRARRSVTACRGRRTAQMQARRRLVAARDMLLEHDVEVGAAETEGADPAAPHPALRRGPLAQLGVDLERRVIPVDDRVRIAEVEARHEHLVVQAERHLEQPRGAGAGLQVADVRLHRAERDAVQLRAGGAEDGGQALEFGRVADARGRAMRLDRGGGGGADPGQIPGALDGELLADRVRGGDALALAVARSVDADDDGVDAVAVALGVLEPLEHVQCAALAHHETVGGGVEGARAGGREGADLAELDEGRDAHVAVDAAGDHGVEAVVDQALDRRVHRRQARGAGRVGGEVGAAQVEQVGDASGHHVRQFARHRVFVDLGRAGAEGITRLDEDALALLGRQLAEARRLLEPEQHLGQLDAHAAAVVLLAADRVAEDHRHAVGVDLPVRPAGVHQCRARGAHGPALALVHLLGHLGRYRQLPAQRIPGELAHPAADLRVSLVHRRVVGRVVQRRIPALGRHLGDRIAAFAQVGPEGLGVGRLRHDGRDTDDCDR